MTLIQICQVCDENVLRPIIVTWKSIVMNNPYYIFSFHLIHCIDNKELLLNFEKDFKDIHPDIVIKLYYHIPNLDYHNNRLKHVSKATMLKLYIPVLLNEIQKVLYLDTDILVTNDLDRIWKLDCGETGLCIKSSIMPLWKEKDGYRCGNAGVILMDLNTLRTNNFTEKVLASNLEEPADDQEHINKYARGKYNDLNANMNIFVNQDDNNCTDPIIYHFIGPNKPWNSNSKNYLFKLWESYNKISLPLSSKNNETIGIGVLIYNTTNFGDWTQTAAALYVWWIYFRRPDTFKNFVEDCIVKSKMGPYPISWINRDKISEYNKPKGIDKLVILCNAWWMKKNSNDEYSFIPQNFIKPIYISFHIANVCLMTDKVIQYLKMHEPIGCRDTSTKDLLERKGVKAYFSGCLTMILNLRDTKLGFTTLNNYVGDKVSVDYKHETSKNYIQLTQLMIDVDNKYNIVITVQRCYDLLSSCEVLTTRLHMWLPLICNKANIQLINIETNEEFKNGDCDNHRQKINRFNGIIETVKDKSKLEVFKCLLLNNTLYEINKNLSK